ncbi:hypothetical protein ACFQT0_30150 [Hymenobacter humi]|uniref:Secreted protein n=1 Tax=Hymenobacter humi TaxID=1411620 RepID=A0ABW2UDS0_9BACT
MRTAACWASSLLLGAEHRAALGQCGLHHLRGVERTPGGWAGLLGTGLAGQQRQAQCQQQYGCRPQHGR